MVDTNKILTVSYGTFSCTLEGFDDSFGTMKAIAEYFRDLAADDRYFGAEPPTPDAEMLARIAEKEISRRVEAHLDKNNIVLRADRGSILPLAMREAAPDQAASTPAEAEAEPAAAKIDLAGEAEGEAEVEAAADNIEPVAEDISEDILAEAAGIADQAAPVAETMAETIAENPEETAAASLEDDASDFEESTEEESVQAEAAAFADDIHEDAAAEAETAKDPKDPMPVFDTPSYEGAFEDDMPQTMAAPADTAAPQAETQDDDTNSVAAKLRRIRAVVSQGSSAGADPLYSEDEHADDFLAETHQELEAALAIGDDAEVAENAPAATGDEGISTLLERFGAEDDDSETEDDDALFFPESFEDEDEIEVASQDEDAAAPDLAAEIAETGPEAGTDDEVEALEEDDVAQEAAPIRARIIKMKRVDFEAAVASGGIEEELAGDATSLSHEEEEELLRELAAVEAELQGADIAEAEDAFEEDNEYPADDADVAAQFEEDFEDEDEDEDDDFARFDDDAGEDDEDDNIFGADDSEGEHAENDDERDARFIADAESEMGRIFAEADTQMDEETGKGRRNAIAHLRAAVAAAKAEEGVGGKLKGEGPDTEAYRDDLANVVRPRRPEPGKIHTQRPETARPAPLKLVAEQRVDIDDAKSAAPVRPRRVTMSPAALPEDVATESDFAEYAESVGAGSLPELLEAAAAYLSFVEGREQFSRPQLMTHVRQVEKDEFSREDGLRSFGQLLREGKIEKLEGGRFKASESISYRPDARYAGE